MVRVLAAVVLVVATGRWQIAAAAPRKVTITTTPPGAQVYLESKEDGPKCTTPCTINAPENDTPIIIEIEGHKPLVEVLSVSGKQKTIKVSYKLEPAMGRIKVTGPKGATVTVNDEDRGKAPVDFEIEAGSYVVVLSMNGKQIDAQPVSIEADDEVVVTGGGKAVANRDDDDDDDDADDDDDDDDRPDDLGKVEETVTATPPRGKILLISAVMDIGFRSFTYEDVETMNTLSDEFERGQVLIGPVIELWPGVLLGQRWLRGLSVLLRYQYGANSQEVKGPAFTGKTTTFWRSLEASVRHRWLIANSAALEVGTGFVQDTFRFNGNVSDIMLVPDAQYRSLRIGARVAVPIRRYEPFIAAENRIVLSGGTLEQRFPAGSTVSGLRGALGVGATFGKFTARLEGSLTQYSWTFKFDNGANFKAKGGQDSIKQISFGFGYAY